MCRESVGADALHARASDPIAFPEALFASTVALVQSAGQYRRKGGR